MATISRKSQKFLEWIRKTFGRESGVADVELLLALEQSARLLQHVYTLTGNLDENQAKSLFTAVDNLKKAYDYEDSKA